MIKLHSRGDGGAIGAKREFGPLRSQGGLPGGGDARAGIQKVRKTQVAKKGEKKHCRGWRESMWRGPVWVGATEGSEVAGGLEQRQKGLGAGGRRG